jgi:hypothetical protein
MKHLLLYVIPNFIILAFKSDLTSNNTPCSNKVGNYSTVTYLNYNSENGFQVIATSNVDETKVFK